jgi:hypothetical protein
MAHRTKIFTVGGQSSSELSRSYFLTLKKTSPNALKLYNQVGNGDPMVGFDTVKEEKQNFVNKIRDYYYMIADSDMMFKTINLIICDKTDDVFSGPPMINAVLWQKLWRVDSFVSYRSYNQLKEVSRVLDELFDTGIIKEIKE